MWEFGTAAAAIVALLVPAAPGQAPPPRPPSAPGCIVPVGSTLGGCPRDELRAPVLCIVPVTGVGRTPLEPHCPGPVPDPRGRFVPVIP